MRIQSKFQAGWIMNIPTEVLKKGLITLAGPIACLCNVSMATVNVLNLFKKAIVHPVYKGKGKNPKDPGSYRPIVILPSLSKVLEIVVHDALTLKRVGGLNHPTATLNACH